MNYEKLLLNVMISGSIEKSLDQHCTHGLRNLDIKMDWSGSMIESSNKATATRIAAAAAERGLGVWCLSTGIGNCSVDDADARLTEQQHLLDNVLSLVPVLQPRAIRLILPRGDAVVVNNDKIIAAYKSWCAQIGQTGCQVVIENEIGQSIGRDPQLVKQFFKNINADASIRLIWDVANQWQDGRYPTLADYNVLQDIIGMLHVKGGQWNNARDRVYSFKSQLANSDWPVEDICQAAIKDGVSAICINPPHGQTREGWSYDLAADLTFLHQLQEFSHVSAL